MNCIRVTETQIRKFLVASSIIPSTSSPSTCKAQIGNFQRYIIRKGFTQGKKKAKPFIREEHIVWRDRYFRKLLANRALPRNQRRKEVYFDESYIHHHYSRSENSVIGSTDPSYEEVKGNKKGLRYCFCAAIYGFGRDNKLRLVKNSVWRFSPQLRDGHKGDYHRNFNSLNFIDWFQNKLLPYLSQPSLIILDNAKYHKSYPINTPQPSKKKKQEGIYKLQELKIEHDEGITSSEGNYLLLDWIQRNVPAEVIQPAEHNGHQILFTPPEYSDLQPIELLWAHIKGSIGRQCSSNTLFQNVRARLDVEFDKLHNKRKRVGKNLIMHVDTKINFFREEAKKEASMSAVDDEDFSSSSDSESYCSDTYET